MSPILIPAPFLATSYPNDPSWILGVFIWPVCLLGAAVALIVTIVKTLRSRSRPEAGRVSARWTLGFSAVGVLFLGNTFRIFIAELSDKPGNWPAVRENEREWMVLSAITIAPALVALCCRWAARRKSSPPLEPADGSSEG